MTTGKHIGQSHDHGQTRGWVVSTEEQSHDHGQARGRMMSTEE